MELFESSPLRRFFLEPSVATLSSEGIATLLDPVDDPTFVPNENLEVGAKSEGAVEFVVELLPKEKEGVVAEAVVAAAAELLQKEKAGAPRLPSLSFVVTLGKPTPLLLSPSTLLLSWADSVVETCSEIGFMSFFVPKLNFGAV